jgi:hypothetical protein
MKLSKQTIARRNRLWADALLANKKKARNAMCNKAGGHCCLMVAETVARQHGVKTAKSGVDDGAPKALVRDFFGWDSCTPKLFLPDGSKNAASEINDGFFNHYKGLSHKQIAECVLNTFVHPAKKKWSFKL